METKVIWVCSENPLHRYDDKPGDWCPVPNCGGFLVDEEVTAGGQAGSQASTPQTTIVPPPPPQQPIIEREVGLCVLLMDASSSMTDPAFAGSTLSRLRIVSMSAASGIFSLEHMQNNPNAYVAGFKFDDRVELMFIDTVANLITRFKDVKVFADYLYDELFKMQRGTDINKALQQAYLFVDKFLKKELEQLPFTNYAPMMQRIMKPNLSNVTVANVRVLIYTDGRQYDAVGNQMLQPNPFRTNPLPKLNHDIVIGAYFGNAMDDGCRELQTLLSLCPRHDALQFFLFDTPKNIGTLRHLFRMASGASGFCPKCLANDLSR